MRFTDEEQLYSYIAKLMLDDNIDFVACPIISPWHAMGVDALAYDILQRKKQKPSGVIVITPHLRGKFTISEVDFVCRDFANVRFCYLDLDSSTKNLNMSGQIDLARTAFDILLAIKELKKTHKESKSEIHIVTALFPNVFILRAFRIKELACKYYPIFSLIDEGMGTYTPEKLRHIGLKLIRQKEPRYFQVTRFLRVKMMHNAANALKIIGGKCLAIEKRFLLEKSHGKLIPNRQFADLYKKILEKRVTTYKRHARKGPVAIIVSVPISYPGSQGHETTVATELNFIEVVISILIETGFSVVIKPHPTEPVNKYSLFLAKFKSGQVMLAEQEVAAEIIFSRLRPDCVLGYDSTSLVNASVICDIPAIRITDILLSKVDAHYHKLVSELFKRLTSEILYDVDNFEKLRQLLNSLASSGAANTGIHSDKIA